MSDFTFELGFEEKLIQDTLQDAFQKLSSSSVVRETLENTTLNKDIHKFLCEQGLLGMLSPRNKSDGMNLLLSTILVNESGKRLLPFPVIEHLLGLNILKQNSDSINVDTYEVGEKLVTIGWQNNLKLTNHHGVISLTGSIQSIPYAMDTDTIVVPFISNNGTRSALILQNDAYKDQLKLLKAQDGTYPLYELYLENVEVDNKVVRLVEFEVEDYTKVSDLLIAAELLGISQEALQMSIDYMEERKQFGIQIGKFQSLKHMIADMHVLCESIKVSVEFGAWSVENEGEDFEIVSTVAKAYASDAALKIVEDAIQIHGGVGFTWEHDLHLYLKRVYRLVNISKSVSEERDKIATNLFNVLNKESLIKSI